MKLNKLKSKINSKQKSVSSGSGTPGIKEGRNGDLTVRNIAGRGLFLYYKFNGKWYSTRLNKIHPKYAEDKESVIVPKGRKSRKLGELTLDSSNNLQLCKKATTGVNKQQQIVSMNSDNKLDISEFKTLATRGTSHTSTDMKIENQDGHASLWLNTAVASTDYDAYIFLTGFSGEAHKLWSLGIDRSDASKFKIDHTSQGLGIALPNPVGSNTKLTLTSAGALTTAGSITDGSGNTLSAHPITALNSAAENELVTVGTTTTELDAEANLLFDGTGLKIKEAADASSDTAGYGQIWVDTATPNILMFTDDAGQDIHLTKNTAVWGGGFARTTGANGKWLGIPTGHQGGYISFGTTDTAPDVIYNPTTTADDLGGVIWQSIHSIRVTACRIWYGEGGSSNTRHILCLMRYDIDSSGTLSNGVEVAGVDADSGSDDYTTLAFTDLTMTSDDTVTNTQVLIAMIYNSDLANAAMTAKCILEYQDLP